MWQGDYPGSLQEINTRHSTIIQDMVQLCNVDVALTVDRSITWHMCSFFFLFGEKGGKGRKKQHDTGGGSALTHTLMSFFFLFSK
jgi:hypothetical protein